MPTDTSWLRPMDGRDPDEDHRQASFLELFFDLCFVIAVAQVASGLHHAVAEGIIFEGLLNYASSFFAIWWAWMNFTWFASAYDNDDAAFRIATFVQIAGSLILAAGVPRAFADGDFNIVFAGYLVMRLGLVTMWLRVAFQNPGNRKTAIRYAIGLVLAMVGWSAMAISDAWPIAFFWTMAVFELLVPVFAERAGATPWHAGHIAERYGLFTIIVLGESILAATIAVQTALDAPSYDSRALIPTVVGGLLILFSMWSFYFSRSADSFLASSRDGFLWGYGHYLILGAAAAAGAGIAVNVDYATDHSELTHLGAGLAVAIPVAGFVLTVWWFHLRLHGLGWRNVLFPLSTLLILAGGASPWPVAAVGGIMTAVVLLWLVMSGADGAHVAKFEIAE